MSPLSPPPLTSTPALGHNLIAQNLLYKLPMFLNEDGKFLFTRFIQRMPVTIRLILCHALQTFAQIVHDIIQLVDYQSEKNHFGKRG